MAIPDDILGNILSRLPAKPMGRCRCVSTHWNRLISDPSFMMSRSSSIIFLSGYESGISIDILQESSGSVTNLDFSMFNKIPTIKNWDDRFVTIVGTFSGIILLEERMILYNPFTCVYEIFHDPYSPVPGGAHRYGFGYGATRPDELKFIRLRLNFNHSKRTWDTCEVLNLKTRSWCQPLLNIQDALFKDKVGMFLKGYLYWMCRWKIVAFNVETMVFSEIQLPAADSTINNDNHLGTCRGCLWMISNPIKTFNFDVWVMNEQGSWSKACSLTPGLEPQCDRYSSQIIKVTEDGRIKIFIITNDYQERIEYKQTIIYDTSKHSYTFLKSSSSRSEALSQELSEELS